jgi:hypothetical protein
MPYVFYNPHPTGSLTGDCVIRALSKVLNQDWDTTYLQLSVQGYLLHNWGNEASVWGSLLRKRNFKRYAVPNTCPDCYTIREFVRDNPTGTYVIACGGHVVASVNGNYFDITDSGNEIPIYFWKKEG